MATRSVTAADLENGSRVYTWTGLTKTTDDVGDAIKIAGAREITVQMTGTLGSGGVIAMKGSMAGTTYHTLNDNAAAALTLSALGIKVCASRPVWLRPEVTAGENAVTDLTIAVHVR